MEIEITQGEARGTDLDRTHHDTIVDWSNLKWMGTPCGDQIVHGTWVTESHYTFHAVTYGSGGEGAPDATEPTITWTIAGVAVAETGPLQIPATTGTTTVVCTLSTATGQLTVDTRGGDKVSGSVLPEISSTGVSLSAVSSIDTIGSYTGFRPWGSTQFQLTSSHIELLIPPGPDPYRERWKDELNVIRLNHIIDVVESLNPDRAATLKEMAKLRYGGVH